MVTFHGRAIRHVTPSARPPSLQSGPAGWCEDRAGGPGDASGALLAPEGQRLLAPLPAYDGARALAVATAAREAGHDEALVSSATDPVAAAGPGTARSSATTPIGSTSPPTGSSRRPARWWPPTGPPASRRRRSAADRRSGLRHRRRPAHLRTGQPRRRSRRRPRPADRRGRRRERGGARSGIARRGALRGRHRRRPDRRGRRLRRPGPAQGGAATFDPRALLAARTPSCSTSRRACPRPAPSSRPASRTTCCRPAPRPSGSRWRRRRRVRPVVRAARRRGRPAGDAAAVRRDPHRRRADPGACGTGRPLPVRAGRRGDQGRAGRRGRRAARRPPARPDDRLRHRRPRDGSPFATGYEVLDVLPFGLKRLRSLLRDRDVGVLTIKKRGSAIEPETVAPAAAPARQRCGDHRGDAHRRSSPACSWSSPCPRPDRRRTRAWDCGAPRVPGNTGPPLLTPQLDVCDVERLQPFEVVAGEHGRRHDVDVAIVQGGTEQASGLLGMVCRERESRPAPARRGSRSLRPRAETR